MIKIYKKRKKNLTKTWHINLTFFFFEKNKLVMFFILFIRSFLPQNRSY